ncbi:yae1 domain-containing protein 1-like [Tropilaelaps mercedesae]|uniref:Yae1 domain-containing protein 1-like n=1 Tax=Tropilaelaps mercedesae TaxID=418985 RepID=A0A1V9XUW4_9ACAR|nr:yae1 domain-containing protein 1-like [Tropilaelaps mercedesae]
MADDGVLLNKKEATVGAVEASRGIDDPERGMADGGSESDGGEGCEARRLAEKEFVRKDEATASDGLREGLAEGKDKALQQGFDSGFKQDLHFVSNPIHL